MIDNKNIQQFNKNKEKQQQDELTQLEINQIELEKKLEREKKNATRHFLNKTIQDNKIRIANHKEQIKIAKREEKYRMNELEAVIEEENRQKKILEHQNKVKTHDAVKKQMALQYRAKEDEYALDRLAQQAQDKRNKEQDIKDRRTNDIRRVIRTDILLHNQEQLNNKQWHRDLDDKLVKDDKTEVKRKVNNWAFEDNNNILDNKQHKNKHKNELREMMNIQTHENESKMKNNLKMEKKLLEDSSKFDNFVSDIVLQKRQFLDKLREQRPF